MKTIPSRGRFAVVAAVVIGLAVPLLSGPPSQAAPLVADVPQSASPASSASSDSERSKPRIVVLGYPRKLTIGGSAEKGCAKSVRVKIEGPGLDDGRAFDLIYAAYVVDSSQPMDPVRLRNVVPGKSYRLYPYPKPEYGPGYEVTLCGTYSSQLLPLPVRTKQVGTISIDLVEAGSSGRDPVVIQRLKVKIQWKGNAQ
jgi:hypothetical protein